MRKGIGGDGIAPLLGFSKNEDILQESELVNLIPKQQSSGFLPYSSEIPCLKHGTDGDFCDGGTSKHVQMTFAKKY